MNDTPRSELAALAGLAFAGIAAYAGYRAIDAERRNQDPSAKPLKDHVADTARSDLDSLRKGLETRLRRISDAVGSFASAIESEAEELKKRASGAAPSTDARPSD